MSTTSLVDDVLFLLVKKSYITNRKIALCSKTTLEMFVDNLLRTKESISYLKRELACFASVMDYVTHYLAILKVGYAKIESYDKLPLEDEMKQAVEHLVITLPCYSNWFYKNYTPECVQIVRDLLHMLPAMYVKYETWNAELKNFGNILSPKRYFDCTISLMIQKLPQLMIPKLLPQKQVELGVPPSLYYSTPRDYKGNGYHTAMSLLPGDFISVDVEKREGDDYPLLYRSGLKEPDVVAKDNDLAYKEVCSFAKQELKTRCLQLGIAPVKDGKIVDVGDMEEVEREAQSLDRAYQLYCAPSGYQGYCRNTTFTRGDPQLAKQNISINIRGRLDGRYVQGGEFAKFTVTKSRIFKKAWFLNRNLERILESLLLIENIVQNMENATEESLYSAANSLLCFPSYLKTIHRTNSYVRNYTCIYTDYNLDWYAILSAISANISRPEGNNDTLVEIATEPLQCPLVCEMVEKDPVIARAMFNFLKRGHVSTMFVTRDMYKALWKYEEFREDLSKYATVNLMLVDNHMFRLNVEQEDLWQDLEGNPEVVYKNFDLLRGDKYAIPVTRHPKPYFTKEDIELVLGKYNKILIQYEIPNEVFLEELGEDPSHGQHYRLLTIEDFFLHKFSYLQASNVVAHLSEINLHLFYYNKGMLRELYNDYRYQDRDYTNFVRHCQMLGLVHLINYYKINFLHYQAIFIRGAIPEDDEEYPDLEKTNILTSQGLSSYCPVKCRMLNDPRVELWSREVSAPDPRNIQYWMAVECVMEASPLLYSQAKEYGVTLEHYIGFLQDNVNRMNRGYNNLCVERDNLLLLMYILPKLYEDQSQLENIRKLWCHKMLYKDNEGKSYVTGSQGRDYLKDLGGATVLTRMLK